MVRDFELYAVRVFCTNFHQSVEFYRDVIGLPLAFVDGEAGWAQFQLGSAYLGIEKCEHGSNDAQELVGRFVGISIAVKDIHSSYEQLSGKGVEFTAPPTKQPWGGILAHFKDPDGNIITLLGEP